MISDYLTEEQLRVSNHNKYLAWKALGYEYYNHRGLSLHHKDETLLHNDIERYILWLPEDLEVVDKIEHSRIHLKGKPKTVEHRAKLRAAKLGGHWHLENGVRVYER